MNREIYKIYDVIMKIITLFYLNEFLRYIGELREIKEILQTEIITLNGKTRYLDFLCLLADETLCHIEFQFPVAYPDDLNRFFNYNITAEIKYDKTTNTRIFNFTEENQGAKETRIGRSKGFFPDNFYLGNIDFEHELEKINIKLGLNQLEKIINDNEKNIILSYEEELHLLLMSLAPKYENKKKLLKPIVSLLKNEKIFHTEKIDIIKSIIQLEIDNLLTDNQKKEFDGGIIMTDETERIIKQAVDEVNKKYEQEALYQAEKKGLEKGMEKGLEKGLEKGRKKREEEIAKNLKGIISPEEISKVTGLSLSTILLL